MFSRPARVPVPTPSEVFPRWYTFWQCHLSVAFHSAKDPRVARKGDQRTAGPIKTSAALRGDGADLRPNDSEPGLVPETSGRFDD